MREFKGKSIIALPSDYIVIDTETTGLDYDFCNLIEVAASKYSNGICVDTFETLVQPPLTERYCFSGEDQFEVKKYYVDDFIAELTGITNEMLSSAPLPDEILPKLLDFIGDSILIGHNINFDINFLYDAAIDICQKPLQNNYIDTLRIARKVFPKLEHHRLSDVAQVCNIVVKNSHRALDDCCTTAACYEYMRAKILESMTEEQFVSQFTYRYKNSLKSIVATTEGIDPTNPIYGKTVVFTGTLRAMPRKEAFQIVANLGGIPKDEINSNTNYLVIGSAEFVKSVKEGKTGKMKKAEILIQKGFELSIISEAAFFDLISDHQEAESSSNLTRHPLSNSPNIIDENNVFDVLRAPLESIIQANNADIGSLQTKQGKLYSSVFYGSLLVFRICCRNNAHYFGVSNTYTNCADETVLDTIIKGRSDDGFTNFEFKPNADGVRLFEEFLSAVLDMVIDSIPKQFDCCSRYEACSDAKKCIHPKPDMALACGYRKIMKKNRIYYGKNRNVD